MRIYAHRGVSAHLPENTLAAFRRAVELGVAGIELDVHLSADGVPVVIHDYTADRTTNGTGRIGEFTARELSLLDAGNGEFVPTLEQVLRLAAGVVRVNIEIKDAASTGPVAKVVAGVAGLDWFASSSDWSVLAQLGQRIPGAKLYPLCVGRPEKMRALQEGESPVDKFTGRTLPEAIAFARSHSGEGVSVWEGGLDQEDMNAIHNAGLQAWVWTVNDSVRARELQAMGADAICTDDPELLQAATAVSAEMLFAAQRPATAGG